MKGNLQQNGMIHFGKGADMRELVEWFKQKKSAVHPAIFETICSKAYEQLPFEKWIVVKTVLGLKEPMEAAA